MAGRANCSLFVGSGDEGVGSDRDNVYADERGDLGD